MRSSQSDFSAVCIAGGPIDSVRGLGTLQENIVVGIGTNANLLEWPNPETDLRDCLKHAGNDFGVAGELGTSQDIFVLGINATARTKLN
jgi:hypothetical protein